MSEDDRWNYLLTLDDNLLKGGVILSEWCTFVIQEADIAFVSGANLASIVMAVSAMETYLRSESEGSSKTRLYELIEQSSIDESLKEDINKLRRYRNKWVHVDDPWDDNELQKEPSKHQTELEQMAFFAAKTLRRTIYENQWV
ncbi:MAG: hypothetical protein WD044_09000 [Dongiaceae bacterium]